MTKNKKLIIGIIIAIIIITGAVIGATLYKNHTGKIYSGEGIYYSQQNENQYLQFSSDNTFTMVNKTDENSAEISKGTWEDTKNDVTITFTESDTQYVLNKTKDGYLYRNDTVFRGKTNDNKLLNNRFVFEKDGEIVEELWFLEDGTMDYHIIGNTKRSYGTYTRVDNILIVRYDDNPDVPERFLVLENGISKDIFNPKKAAKVTQ